MGTTNRCFEAVLGGVFLALVSGMGPVDAAPSRVLRPVPGGIDPHPILYGITNHQGALQVTGGGFQGGPFQLVQSTNASGTGWIKTGAGPRTTTLPPPSPTRAAPGSFA